MIDARNIGLRNIEVADTKISSIDGENGKLIYRGYDILDLVNHSTFEETAYLLIFGELPNSEQLVDFTERMIEARSLPSPILRNLSNRPKRAEPMDVIQSAISELPDYDLNMREDTKSANIRRAITLIGKIPSIVAAWDRIRLNIVLMLQLLPLEKLPQQEHICMPLLLVQSAHCQESSMVELMFRS